MDAGGMASATRHRIRLIVPDSTWETDLRRSVSLLCAHVSPPIGLPPRDRDGLIAVVTTLESFLMEPRRVLMLAPHPDDESLGTGGLIQRATRAGGEVHVVFVTDGDNNP